MPKKIDQSRVKTGHVPHSSSTSRNKSTGKNTVDENQSTFKTGVVVSLTTQGCQADASSDGGGEYSKKNQSQKTSLVEEGMELSQSKSLYHTAVNQSKLQSLENSKKKKNISDIYCSLQANKLLINDRENNIILGPEMFNQINQDQAPKDEESLVNQDVPGSTSKKPKLVDPCIMCEV